MYSFESPYIPPEEQMNAAKIFADIIANEPEEFCVSDYGLFTTMFGHEAPGSTEARQHFYAKLQEETGELDDELRRTPIDPNATVEEYGDSSFSTFALGNAFKLDLTLFIKELWARKGIRDIDCRADEGGPPYVESAIRSGAPRRYTPTRYGFAVLHQPYPYELHPGETYEDHRSYQIELVGRFLTSPLKPEVQYLVGYTLADVWLGETRRVSEALDNDGAMLLGMAHNITKIIDRIEESRKYPANQE